MGTVPRQKSVPNSSMRHRELQLWRSWWQSDSSLALTNINQH
jgi:hypothetical protein